MANSTQVITDMQTVITNGPSVATTSNVTVASGAIMDYAGNCKLVKLKMQEISVLLAKIVAQTDSGSDGTNLSLLQNIKNDFV
jgi:hypothetical protein